MFWFRIFSKVYSHRKIIKIIVVTKYLHDQWKNPPTVSALGSSNCCRATHIISLSLRIKLKIVVLVLQSLLICSSCRKSKKRREADLSTAPLLEAAQSPWSRCSQSGAQETHKFSLRSRSIHTLINICYSVLQL